MRGAHWVRKTHLFKADEYVCSACGAVSCKAYRVCPSCRAAMRKVKYEASWVDEAEGLSALMDNDW